MSFVKHGNCLKCKSTDANAYYTDGTSYCFSCRTFSSSSTCAPPQAPPPPPNFRTGSYISLTKRKILKETCRKYDYMVADNGFEIANYYDKHNKVVAQKLRSPDKQFQIIGNIKNAMLFGAHLFDSGEYITITEGEIDALTFSQINNNRYPVISITTGAAGAYNQIKKHLEYFDKFKTVVFMFDSDKAGTEAAHACVTLLPYGKAKIATLPYKDVSEAYVAGDTQAVIASFYNARSIVPSGIVCGTDLWDKLLESEKEAPSVPYPWSFLNDKLKGLRCKELVTITAGSGAGKTSFIKELAYYLGCVKENNVGLLLLEEDVVLTAKSLMALHMNVPANDLLEYTKDTFRLTVGNERIFLYDSFGSTSVENLLNRVRYLAVGCNCKYVILDHISLVVSGIITNDERKLIDVLMTKLRSLAQETGICLIIVSHLRRIENDRGHEQGAQVAVAHLRGSHSVAQLSNIVIALERNQQSIEDADTISVRILKNRYNGRTGLAGIMHYNAFNGRLTC